MINNLIFIFTQFIFIHLYSNFKLILIASYLEEPYLYYYFLRLPISLFQSFYILCVQILNNSHSIKLNSLQMEQIKTKKNK